jgi:predicted MarR family transcription regulator
MTPSDTIVSSAHLVSEKAAELSQLEYGLIVASNAFDRWMVHCMAAAGVPDLSPLDVLVLHNVNHRAREKTLAAICLVLNIEDTHLVSYSLKKLRRLGLVEGRRRGKEAAYVTTEAGQKACSRYREIRETCLVDALEAIGGPGTEEVAKIATRLRAFSGIYDQAARAATSL